MNAHELGDVAARHRNAVTWLLGVIGLGPPAPPPPWDPLRFAREPLMHPRFRVMCPTIFAGARTEGDTLQVSLLDRRDQRFEIRLVFAGDVLVECSYGWPLGEGLRLIEVGIEKADVVAAIERDAPVALDDGTVLRMYRPKLHDLFRLQDDTRIAVIERAGTPVAVRVWALRTVAEDGSTCRIGTSQFARVLPEARGANLMRGFVSWESRVVEPLARAEIAFVDVGNSAVTASFRTRDYEWTRRAVELTFDCAAIAGPNAGRPSRPSDAGHIASLADAAHGSEALYVRHDAATITRRLERAPDVYGWGDVLVEEDAMLGVWASLDESEMVAPRADAAARARRRVVAVALDHGWRGEAGVDAFMRVLAAQAGRVLALGATHLVLHTWPGSPLHLRCAELAEQSAELAVQTDLQEPSDRQGVHVDPIYL